MVVSENAANLSKDVMTKRVLFVCMGNICRSPAGEAVMQRFAEEFRVDVEVDSAGTHGYHVGELADRRMRGPPRLAVTS